MRNENKKTDLEIYLQARIDALENLVEIQNNLIDAKSERIDELSFQKADAEAKLNMLIRNIEVVDSVFEKPLN